MRKQTNKIVLKLIICFIFFSLHINTVYAVEKMGSISLYCHYIDDGKVVEIANTSFQIVKVADYVEGEFVNVNDFQSFKTIPTKMNASQMKDISSELQTYMNDYDVSFTHFSNTNKNGYVQFKDLDMGLYFISQVENENQNYYTEPFLLSIPMIEENEIFHVYAEPKFAWKDNSENETIIPTLPKDSVDTGDQSNMSQYLIMMGISLSCMTIFLVGKKRKTSNGLSN